VRWVGIDEAGYGPNLGPLVMTAVIAESRDTAEEGRDRQQRLAPDLWRDLATTVVRGGGDAGRFWVDDSKVVLRGGHGRPRLEATCLALLDAVGRKLPRDQAELLDALGAGTPAAAELDRWQGGSGAAVSWPPAGLLQNLGNRLACKPLEPADRDWRITAVRSVVLGPERFNGRLATLGSKASVHFTAFGELLRHVWDLAADGTPTDVQGDKHGGRHYYLEPLVQAFPETWIDRGVEGPALSRYQIRDRGRSLSLSLSPRADGNNGLVALASIVSKTVREVWMDVFNAYWMVRVQDLLPTAGYPVDAVRFRRAIEPIALAGGLDPDLWWRRK
jgi:hypothetical protein